MRIFHYVPDKAIPQGTIVAFPSGQVMMQSIPSSKGMYINLYSGRVRLSLLRVR